VNVQRIVEELRRCPAWITFRADEHEFRAGITRLYSEIAASDNQTIRAAVQELFSEFGASSLDRFQTDAKAFALWRVLFAIPTEFVPDGKNYGSWGSPVKDGRVNLLWPYEIEAGRLVLVGTGGRYFGAPYDALAEFDELAARFGRRKATQ